jgi:hypothetical protein
LRLGRQLLPNVDVVAVEIIQSGAYYEDLF